MILSSDLSSSWFPHSIKNEYSSRSPRRGVSSSTEECNRIVDRVYLYSWNFATLFASHLSSILALFFLKSLVKLLLHDERFLILNPVLPFHRLFHYYKC